MQSASAYATRPPESSNSADAPRCLRPSEETFHALITYSRPASTGPGTSAVIEASTLAEPGGMHAKPDGQSSAAHAKTGSGACGVQVQASPPACGPGNTRRPSGCEGPQTKHVGNAGSAGSLPAKWAAASRASSTEGGGGSETVGVACRPSATKASPFSSRTTPGTVRSSVSGTASGGGTKRLTCALVPTSVATSPQTQPPFRHRADRRNAPRR
jgi:hypothetical protein